MTATERKLLVLLKARCYQEGDFTLASGQKSGFYFDARTVFQSSAAVPLIGQAIYDKLAEFDLDAIGGLEVGAIPLTTSTVYAYHQHHHEMEGFFVRNKAKDHGTKKIIEGTLRAGSRVAILDDVATKGGSIMKAVDAVRKAESTPEVIVVLVDRQEGAGELFAREGILFRPLFTIAKVKAYQPETAVAR